MGKTVFITGASRGIGASTARLFYENGYNVVINYNNSKEKAKALADSFKAEYKKKLGVDFPSDPKEQLMGAIKAVFRSWDNPRAIYYRRKW